jgi:hypothetical protein
MPLPIQKQVAVALIEMDEGSSLGFGSERVVFRVEGGFVIVGQSEDVFCPDAHICAREIVNPS